MHVAINIYGQFQKLITGLQYCTDSLLEALYASDTAHCITAFTSSSAAIFETPEGIRDDLFRWRGYPGARVDTVDPEPWLGTLFRVARHAQGLPVLGRLNKRVLDSLEYRIGDARVRSATLRYDLLHTVDPVHPSYDRHKARRQIATIYDMTPRIYPEAHQRGGANWERYYRFVKERCARVITISECSRQDIVRYLNIPEGRIDVTPLAARARTRRIEDPQELRRLLLSLGLAGTPFVLYAGTLEPRKNLPLLIESFARVARQERSLADHRLVLAGGTWENLDGESLRRRATERGVGGQVITTEYVTNDQMNALMTACDAFVYVSKYEGFGMPPLEAMVCGAPVVASNVSSIPEVVGDAGLLDVAHRCGRSPPRSTAC